MLQQPSSNKLTLLYTFAIVFRTSMFDVKKCSVHSNRPPHLKKIKPGPEKASN